MSLRDTSGSRRSAVLNFYEVPGRPNVVQAYCEGCERWSRPVRKPTEADKRIVRERCGDPHAVMNPNPPPGWEHGCPRCDR